MVRRNELGQALLETALIIPVVLGVTLAAVDVNHALRTRAALKEGARTALRCLYTTDGACTTPADNELTPVFDVYQTTVNPKFVSPLYGFKGTLRYIEAPQFEAKFSAKVLDKGYATLSYYDHKVEQRRYPAEASIKTNILYALYPYVTGTTPANARLVWKGRQNRTYSPIIDKSISGVSGTATSRNHRKTIGRLSFTVPSPFNKKIKGCQLSKQFNTPKKARPNLSRACNKRKDFSRNYVNIVIHLTGDIQGATDGTKGAIRMYLEDSRGRTIKDLGGREVIPSPGFRDGSLVPRGVPDQYTSGSLRYWEVTGHSPIRIKYDESYAIRLAIEYRSQLKTGEFQWRGNRLRIYAPKAEVVDGGAVSCDRYLLPSEEGNRKACKSPVISGMGRPKITDWNTYKTDFSKSAVSPNESPNVTSILGDLQTSTSEKDLIVSSDGPLSLEKSFNCPTVGTAIKDGKPNIGVPEESSNGFISSSTTAESICPPEYDPAKYKVSTVKWTERDVVLSTPEPVLWTRQNCSELHVPEHQVPSNLKGYPKLQIINQPSGYAAEVIHTGPGFDSQMDPNTIIENDPLYNCKDSKLPFRVKEETLPTKEQLGLLPADAFFKNFHTAPIRCERQWKQIAFDNAVKELDVPANSYFDSEYTGPHGEELMNHESNNSCYEWKPTGGEKGEQVYLGKFPEDEFPDACKDNKHRCSFTLVGFEGDGGTVTPIADFEKAAKDYGYREIKTMNPRARFDCQDSDCVQLKLSTEDEHYVAQAETSVALNILGGLEVPLNYTEKHRWEGYLVK